jgi:hypothetical protein
MNRFPDARVASVLLKILAALSIIAAFRVDSFLRSNEIDGLTLEILLACFIVALLLWSVSRILDIQLEIDRTTQGLQSDLHLTLSANRSGTSPTVRHSVPGRPATFAAPPPAPLPPVQRAAADPGLGDTWRSSAPKLLSTGLAVEVEPATVEPGGKFTIYAAGGDRAAQIALALVDQSDLARWQTATVCNLDGALKFNVSLPANLPVGQYRLVASTLRGEADAYLTIAPTASDTK